MDIHPGLVFGRYTIEAEIGRGGMGLVVLAVDGILHRKVALKILLPGLVTKEEVVARFFREARLAAQLTHPNTVHIYDLGEIEDIPFIVMEYVDGRPLTAYLGDTYVPADRRMRWMVDVAKGLAAAHARGLLHRDMKPSNVMVSREGMAKVVDFGLAKKEVPTAEIRATFHTAQGFLVGTPAYMAPEQLEAGDIDGRADQFSWALTTYALMLGRNLRTTDPLLFGPIPLLSDQVPGMSRRIAEIVLRALSSDREMRFPTMDALLGELEPALGMAPAVAEPLPTPRPNRAADLSPVSQAPKTPRIVADPLALGPGRKFCPECGVSFALSSSECDGPHASAFPMPPGAFEPGKG